LFTRESNGKILRKASASGAGNDCVYVTSPKEASALVEDSKAEVALALPALARHSLVAFVAATQR